MILDSTKLVERANPEEGINMKERTKAKDSTVS